MKEDRLNQILEIIRIENVISTKKLKRLIGVSEATIRRDLEELAKRGLIRRVFGGAVKIDSIDVELSFKEKMKINISEKKSIALYAANLVKNGERIFLESGTTVYYMIKNLKNKKDISVVTNCLNVANEILKLQGINLTLVGGELREKTYNLIGPLTELVLRNICLDKAFIGVDGIDLAHELTSFNLDEANAMKIVIDNAKETYVLADNTKFEKFAHFKISSFEKITTIITDSGLDKNIVEKYKQKGIRLLIVPINYTKD
ncbi:MAG: DeoR/GlpR family DNA-binding transcription regulator [Minisyncoccia bacterium]